MKKIIAWLLLLAMLLGTFAGCKKEDPDPSTEPSTSEVVTDPTDPEPVADIEGIERALEYVKTVYKTVIEKTAKDFERIGVVPFGEKKYVIVWTTDADESDVKIIVGDNGMVTIDINEDVKEDLEYTLTATVTDEAGNSVSHSWKHVIPASSLEAYIKIVEEAYKLQPGEALDYDVTLKGVITTINTPYDAGYKNVTVTIQIGDLEDKLIMCYRMKGDGADNLMPGDTITVTGIIKNYNGTIEFDAGCTLDEVIKGDNTFELPDDPVEVMKMAYALGVGEALPVAVTLTGVITKVNTPYDAGYKNVTVTMVVENQWGMPIMCYRLKGAGAEQIWDGDTITVTGTLMNYNGTIEFGSGCTLDSWQDTGANQAVLSTPEEIVNALYALPTGGSLQGTYTLTGVITSVDTPYDPGYGNVTVSMVVGNMTDKPIVCYRMKGAGAELVGVGDTITVSGSFIDYNGKKEISPSSLLSWEDTGVDEPVVEPETPANPVVVPVDDIMENTAYKFGMKQGNLEDKIYYLAGGMNGYYLATTENFSEAIDVYLEASGENVYLYTMVEGVKTYINMVVSGTFVNGAYEAAPSTSYDWDETNKTIVASIDGVSYGFGTRNDKTFTTMGPCKTELGGFFGEFYVDGGEAEPEAPEITLVDTPAAETAYKFGMVQGNLENKVYYLAGGMNGYYLETTDDAAKAIDVYLEATDGGYYFYTMVEGTKTYINMVVSGTFVNGAYEATASTVYTYDADSKTIIATIDGVPYWFGTRNDKTFTTVGPVKTEYNGFYCQFYAAAPGEGEGGEGEEGGETEDVIYEPVVEPQVDTAYKFAMIQKNLDNTLYALAGGMDGYYLATTDVLTDAIDVYLETTEGGYYFYTMVDGVKTYINMVVSGTFVNGAYEATASTVYTWDAENSTIITMIDGVPYWFGTRNDKTYTTMGPVKTEYNGFFGQFFVSVDDETDVPEDPEIPEDPEDPEASGYELITIPCTDTAYKFGMVQKNLENKIFYLAGGMDGYYLATTDDVNAAIDVYLEEDLSGIHVYTMVNGVKTYINMVVSGTFVNGAYEATANTAYTWNDANKTVIATIDGAPYWFGTRNDKTYTTMGPVKTEYEGFFGQFYEKVGEPIVNLPTIAEVLAAESGEFTVKGVITMIEGRNVYVQDETGGICAYLSETPSDIALGETIIATGTRGAFRGMPQLSNASFEKSEGLTLTAKETTIDALTTADLGCYVEIKDVTVTEIYDHNGQYATPNVTVEDANGNKIQLYKAIVSDTLAVGDKVNVKAAVGTNNGILQLRNTSADEVTKAAVVVTYKLALDQNNLGKTLYFAGSMSGFYFATTENKDEAVDLYMETVDGGVRFYFLEGTVKKYIDIVERTNAAGKVDVAITETPTAVFVYDGAAGTFTATVAGKVWYLGTYGTYNTISASETWRITGDNASAVGVSQFPCKLV